MSVHHRVARAEDAALIAALHADSWRRTYRGILSDDFLEGGVLDERKRFWNSRLAAPSPNQLVLVTEDSDALLAFICVYGGEDARWGSLVDNLHVRIGAQGGGLGSALLQRGAAWAAGRFPGVGIYLWVIEGNAQARAFYERRGAVNCESMIRENTGGGASTYLRYAWANASDLALGSER